VVDIAVLSDSTSTAVVVKRVVVDGWHNPHLMGQAAEILGPNNGSVQKLNPSGTLLHLAASTHTNGLAVVFCVVVDGNGCADAVVPAGTKVVLKRPTSGCVVNGNGTVVEVLRDGWHNPQNKGHSAAICSPRISSEQNDESGTVLHRSVSVHSNGRTIVVSW
jgi:hypothetical protein